MVRQWQEISLQYLGRKQIPVTILDFLSPVHFVIKESASLDGSSEAKNFIEAEEAMQKYYESVEPCFFQLPLKDSIIVAIFKGKFYRAKVIRILNLTAGHLFKVYLVDYGVECSVPRECIYEIEKDFLSHPFQAVNFKLLGIEPISLIMNSADLTMSYGPVSYWDPSACIFVQDLQKGMCNAHIEVQALDGEHIYGKLFISYENNVTKCINDQLISNTFGRFNEDCWKSVHKIDNSLGSKISVEEISAAIRSLTLQDQNLKQISSPETSDGTQSTLGNFTQMSSPEASDRTPSTSGNFTQMSSSSNYFSVEHMFKMPLVNPADGKIVAECSIASHSSAEDDENLQPEVHIQESNSQSSPVSDVISEKQQFHKSQLQSSLCAKNIDSNRVKNLPVIGENMVNRKKSPVSTCTVKTIQPPTELPSTDFKKTTQSKAISPSKSNTSSNCDNFKSSAANCGIQTTPESSSNQNVMEVQTVGQEKLLKLQKLRRKQLRSPICQSNSSPGSTSMKKLSLETEKLISSKQSADVCTKETDHSSEVYINQGNKDHERIPKFNELNVSSDGNINLNSSHQSNIPVSPSGSNLKQEGMTEAQLIAHKRFQKLQQMRRKKLQSVVCPTNANSSEAKSSFTVTENEANLSNESSEKENNTSPRKLCISSDSIESPQANTSTNVKVSPEVNPRQEDKTEAQLIAHKRFQKLQQMRRKKLQSPICPTSANSSHQTNTSINNVQDSPENNPKQEYASKGSTLNPMSMNKVSQIELNDVAKVEAISCTQEKYQGKRSCSTDKPALMNQITRKVQTPGKNTSKSFKFSESNNLRNSASSDDLYSSPNNGGSPAVNQLLNVSDSDDLLNVLSKKNNEKSSVDTDVTESFLKFSTQLQYSGKKPSDFNLMSLWEKQKVPVLQIGVCVSTPMLTVEEAGFSRHLSKVLKAIKFCGPSCIQSVAWTTMFRKQSMITIAPPQSGKTISYLLPLVSSLTTESITSEELGRRKAPSVIILCSSWIKAQAVSDFFHLFLQDTKVKFATLCTYGGNYKEKILRYISNCDVLIATPFCLLPFLKEDWLSLAQCEHFILDDGTALIRKNKKELKKIFLFLMASVKCRNNFPQIVLSAERWDKNFQIIKDKLMLNPAIFFTSFLESAIFAKVPMLVHVCKVEEKKIDLLNVLNESYKVVICTTNMDDAQAVHHFLRYEDVRSFLVNEEMEHYIADEVINDWKSAQSTTTSHCLVITDAALIKMTISSADCLIHYDIPTESRLQFENRFSCIAENLQGKHYSLLQAKAFSVCLLQKSNPKCVCHIFIGENEYNFASQLVEIVENSGETPSNQLIELCQKRNQNENTSDLLCHYMKAFGFCKKNRCKFRHFIDAESDKPQVVPCEGDIQAIVTHVIDASHYYVRLVKYLDPVSNKTVSLTPTYARIGFQLKDFYKQASEGLIENSPAVGKCYVLAEENSVFYRIKVLDCIPSSSYNLPKWKILFLDEGWVKCYNKLKLYRITDEVNLPQPLVVEVYACKISTPDSSCDWNPQTTGLVANLIGGKEIHGKIALCIKDVLWLDPIVMRLKLSNSNEYVNLFKLDQKLLDYGHVKLNKNHLVSLKQACADRISLPHLTKTNVINEVEPLIPEPSISYAFLDCDVCEDVYVSSVITPHQLYVQRAKFVDCLDELIEKINARVEKRTLKKANTLQKGMHCIALFKQDNRYYRAMVTDVVSYTDEVQLFYVDFGDTGKVSRNNIYSISEEFLLLPYQAIECELAGIAASHGGWTDSAANALVTLTRNDVGDMKILQLKAYNKSRCYEGGNHYAIDLWCNEKKISEQLLQAGFGVPADIPVISSPNISNDNSPYQSGNEIFNLSDNCSTSTDEEMHPEDKVAAAAFYGLLAKMVVEDYNLISKPGATITEISTDEEKEILKSMKKPTMPQPSEVSNEIQQLLPKLNQTIKYPSSSETCSNSVKPLITWWDKPEELNILIHVKDVKVYRLDVTDGELSFNTIIAGKEYSTTEELYSSIISTSTRVYKNVQGINIVAEKITPFKWPRLTKEKRKFLHIRYDLIHIDDSDTEDQPTATKKINIPHPHKYMEEYKSSTDEEENYVQSWKDFAQNSNPCDFMD